jgi:hypothetical protein
MAWDRGDPRETRSGQKPFAELLFHRLVRNTFATGEFPKPFAHACNEIDAFLDVFPRRVFGELSYRLDGDLFASHSLCPMVLLRSGSSAVRNGPLSISS